MNETDRSQPARKIGRARETLLRRLIDCVAMPSSRVSVMDRQMASDILLDMLFEAGEEERILCARRLQNTIEAPRRLMRYLAQCEISIAGHLIKENKSYDESDLVEIIGATEFEHQSVIAERRDLTATVTDALINTEDLAVIRVLLANKNAVLSETGVDKLVQLSRKHDEFCAQLVIRPELMPSQAMAMFWWADGSTRNTILSKHAADRSMLVDLCSDVFSLMEQEKWADPVARKAMHLIERRQRNRAALARSEFESLESAIEVAAQTRLTPEVLQEVGYLAGIRPVCMTKLSGDLGGEGLAVLCKATGLKRAYLPLLWKSMRRPVSLDDGQMHPQLKYVMEVFNTLSVAKAQTVLRYWNWSLTAAGSLGDFPANDADERDMFSASTRTAKLVFTS